MIQLTKLEKFYNKGKLNEIHVINGTTLSFGEKGLVALTGPSGCGKTTLLNVIGGLDSFESGEIDFDGEIIRRYSPDRWDIIRNKYVGYIFQNYNLVTDKTVYENIEITLNMAGLYDKAQVEARINYVLESVGMYNYRRRNVLALSGGQQQRVAIARALAKNPKVILADEPTGNLDANNTYEIMSLIKKISETCLVILVSHEKELVEFYADRIIQLSDGLVIKDQANESKKALERVDDRNIYLKDLEVKSQEGVVPLQYYYQKELSTPPEVKLIYTNNTLYVKVDAQAKINYIGYDSEIRLIDDHYRKKEAQESSSHQFDLSQFGHIGFDAKRKSFIRFRDTLKAGFLKILSHGKFFGKLFIVVYFIISAVIVYNLATFSNLTRVDETEFLNVPRESVTINVANQLTYQKLVQIQSIPSVLGISPYNGAQYLNFLFEDLYQGSGMYRSASGRAYAFPVGLSGYEDAVVISGRLPQANNEVAIDQWLADKLLLEKSLLDLGIGTYEALLGGVISDYTNLYGRITIVGIVSTESPVIILTDENVFFFDTLLSMQQYGAHGSSAGKYILVEGEAIEAKGEVLINRNMSSYALGSTFFYGPNRYTVVGFFSGLPFSVIFEDSDFHELSQKYVLGDPERMFYLETTNAAATLSALSEIGIDGIDAYATARNVYLQQQFESIAGRLQAIFITLAGVIIYIFLMMRSSMLNRIKEIGIYRSIGATKKDIYKIFISEILAFTTLGSLSGYLFMTYIVFQIQGIFGGIATVLYFPFYVFISGIVVIYATNVLFGMIPIYTLLKKTPAEINAKYDI